MYTNLVTLLIRVQLAKILKYLGFQTACDLAFGTFIVSWFFTRHVLYNIVVYSIYKDLPRLIRYGCYWGPHNNLQGPVPAQDSFNHLTIPFRDPQGLVCQTPTTTRFFLGMLLFLQGILWMWFAMIMRLAYKVVKGQSADDPRSDEEDEDYTEEIPVEKHFESKKFIEVPPLEEEVGVEELQLGRRNGRKYRKSNTSSSVSLPHDRKELLGRIGCDKGA